MATAGVVVKTAKRLKMKAAYSDGVLIELNITDFSISQASEQFYYFHRRLPARSCNYFQLFRILVIVVLA
jgi:hypothetical protein